MPGAPLELINLRVRALGLTDKPRFESSAVAARRDASHARSGYRQVYFDGGFVKTPVYEGLKLENGNELFGPAIIEQPNTTLVVPSGYRMACDPYSNYILSPLLPLDGSQN